MDLEETKSTCEETPTVASCNDNETNDALDSAIEASALLSKDEGDGTEMREVVQEVGDSSAMVEEPQVEPIDEDELSEKLKANTLKSPPGESPVVPDTCELVSEETGPYFWPFDWSQGVHPLMFAQTSKAELANTGFLKGCKWAPDGSCLLTNSDDSRLRVFNFPDNVSNIQDWSDINTETVTVDTSWSAAVSVKEGGTVYDYCWYPHASSLQPETSCFLSTSKDTPIHLWDGVYGTLRATYVAVNYADEPIAAYSVAFDPSGEYIYCGYEKSLRIFNIGRPGRDCTVIYLNKSPLPDLNLSGIVSCIAFNPAWSNVYALGTYRKIIGLYMEDGSVICSMDKHKGGITSLVFSKDGTKLYSGARADSKLICWDLRNPGIEFDIFERVVDTQQRIQFELSTDDRYLISGGTDGCVRIWDTLVNDKSSAPFVFPASNTCVNGVSLNPYVPVLATATGKRYVIPLNEDSSDEEDVFALARPKMDNDVKLWKM